MEGVGAAVEGGLLVARLNDLVDGAVIDRCKRLRKDSLCTKIIQDLKC